jgi:hypothetical protein
MHCYDRNISVQPDLGFYASDQLSPKEVPHLRARQLREEPVGVAG